MRNANPAKPRKPYKITKPRERWSQQEHESFLEAIDKFGRDWKQIVTHIGSRSVSQVRSHAQKHFIRLEKKGMGGNVPPARRKARWAEKLTDGSFDGVTESDQEMSVMNQQTSSSSVSTLEHQSMRALLSTSQVLEGLGSTADYSDCQPITSPAQSLSSLASRNSSFTSPSSHTEFITFAQQMLLPGNQQDAAAASSSPHAVPSFTSLQQQQQLQPDERKFVMDVVQQLVSQQQQSQAASVSSAPVPVDGMQNGDHEQQQCVRQLVLQQMALQQALTRQQPSPTPPTPSAHSWRANTSSAVASTSSPYTSSSYPSLASPSAQFVSEYTSALAQQSCVSPRLDGAALAECFQRPRTDSLSHRCKLQQSSHATSAQPSCGQELKDLGMLRHPSPNTSWASNAPSHMLQGSPPLSCDSTVSVVKTELLLEGYSQPPDALAELGLEDMNFWDGMAMEDPLMQAMEAAMGCTDESENCCFHATLSEV